VIYSPLKSRPALPLPLVKTFLTLAVTFTSLVYFINENTLSRDYYGNATSRDANIVVKLTYFRYDRLRSTNTQNHHDHHENRHDLPHSQF